MTRREPDICVVARLAGYHQAVSGVFASGAFPMFPAGALARGHMPQGVVPGGAWPAASYGYVPQWGQATSMALFVPAYLPMQYAGQQLPENTAGQGSQVGRSLAHRASVQPRATRQLVGCASGMAPAGPRTLLGSSAQPRCRAIASSLSIRHAHLAWMHVQRWLCCGLSHVLPVSSTHIASGTCDQPSVDVPPMR